MTKKYCHHSSHPALVIEYEQKELSTLIISIVPISFFIKSITQMLNFSLEDCPECGCDFNDESQTATPLELLQTEV